MPLHPYQHTTVERTIAGWREHKRQLIVLPTGGGKTVVFSDLIRTETGKCLVIAHRSSLVQQAADKISRWTGEPVAIEQADSTARINDRIVVASLQSLHPDRLTRFPHNHFSLVICDEAHHAISASWRQVLSHFDGHARVLGVTATPDRSDKKDILSYFKNISHQVKLVDLIKDGYLAPMAIKKLPLSIDLNQCKTTQGDIDKADVARAIDPYLGQIAEEIKYHASFRRTLVFCPLIATSQRFVDACHRAGLNAAHVDGETSDQAEILERFRNWEFDVLSNAMLLTEGYDDPGINCIVILRPTQSRALAAQMVGRGTRTHPDKDDLLWLDFLWLSERHNLCRPAHLIASDEIEADLITQRLERAAKGGGESEQLDILDVSSEIQDQREEALRKRLEANRKKKGKYISAEEFALIHHQPELADYQPSVEWEGLQPTDRQRTALKRAKIDASTVKTRGLANKILDIEFQSRKLKPASEAVKNYMRRFGAENWQTATEHDGRKFMAALRSKAR